jgi:hypothetical protein
MNCKFIALSAASLLAMSAGAFSQGVFNAGDLLVSTSTYEGTASMIVPGTTVLPNGATATADGAFPEVFNNDIADANFGVTSPIIIQQLTQSGAADPITGASPYVSGDDFDVPTSVAVTSFSSKSELGLNLSTDGSAITFMGYDTAANAIGADGGSPINQLDISNSNTPYDTGNAYSTATYREVVQLNANGTLNDTTTNAYSTNNGRAAILANGVYYTVGNGGSLNLTGAEIVTPGVNATPTSAGTTVLGAFNSDGDSKGKDNNFRAETISNNVLYVDKGSGSKGIDTVYQVGAGSPTANNNVLPTGTSNTISILPGMPGSSLATSQFVLSNSNAFTPFGIFVTGTTMYVADEGLAAPNPGTDVFSGGADSIANQAANDAFAGLTKWTYNGSIWNYDYTLSLGLNLGQQYAVAGYTLGESGTLDPATVGLRALAGEVNSNGTVTLFATTATLSDLGDVGGDANKLVSITDTLGDTTASEVTGESFDTLETASAGEVLRGVSFAPTTTAVPEPATWGMALGGFAFLIGYNRKWKRS